MALSLYQHSHENVFFFRRILNFSLSQKTSTFGVWKIFMYFNFPLLVILYITTEMEHVMLLSSQTPSVIYSLFPLRCGILLGAGV